MRVPDKSSLAIVIPYYKISFFSLLMESLIQQTDHAFTMYIGDDCSPEDPGEIIAKNQKKLSIHYHRFSNRIGHISLAAHWNRCLALLGQEQWVWILPDDDLPGLTCVEAFHQAVKSGAVADANVLIIPTRLIDAQGEVLREAPPCVSEQDNYSFYLQQLKGVAQGSSLGENIFRRSALLGLGGFPEFPKGWGSDHAAILAASAGTKIYCLQRACFGFRLSGINITSHTDDGATKMHAKVQFAQWLKANEHLFSQPPDEEFYRYVYWRGEYFARYEWRFTYGVFWHLLRLRWVCLRSLNIPAVFGLFIKKLLSPRHPVA